MYSSSGGVDSGSDQLSMRAMESLHDRPIHRHESSAAAHSVVNGNAGIVSSGNRYLDANGELNDVDVPWNFHIKIICVILVMYSFFCVFTGRGIFAILQGIVGTLFGVDGYWGTVKYSAVHVRKLIYFLIGYSAASTCIGILNLATVSFFCSTSRTADTFNACSYETTVFAIVSIVGALAIVPLGIAMLIVFHRSIIEMKKKGLSVDMVMPEDVLLGED
jgi:hypothetical protein